MWHTARSIRQGWPLGPAALAAVVLASAPAYAQADGSSDVHRLPLWEIRTDDNTMYILGSIHVLRPEAYPLHDAIYEAFDAAEIVVFELDLGRMQEAAPIMMTRGMYDDDRTLRDALPAELYAEVGEHFREAGVPLQAVERMKPWAAAMMLSSLVLRRAGFEAESGIDMHFMARAAAADKEVIGLETFAEQIDVFDGLDERGQVAFLRHTLDELETTVERLDEATRLWQRGEVEQLGEMMTESLLEQPDLAERLLYARNLNWIGEIEALLASGRPTILIVGVGHLIGSRSVIGLLRERGHEVRRWSAAAVPAHGAKRYP